MNFCEPFAITCSRLVRTTRASATMPCFFDRLPNYSKGLARDLAFRGEIVGPDVIELVDLVSRHEICRLDYPIAFQGDGFELLQLHRPPATGSLPSIREK